MEPVSFVNFAQNQAESVQSLSTAYYHTYISRYTCMAGFAVLIYDHFLTFGTEVQTVWKRPKNIISAIFLANRYLAPIVVMINIYDKAGFATNLSTPVIVSQNHISSFHHLTIKFHSYSCQIWTLIEVHLHLLSHSSIHALVALRVSAIWGHQRTIKCFLIGAWLMYFIATGVVSSYAVFKSYQSFHPEPRLNVCFGTISRLAVWSWVPPLLLEAALFALTVLKAIEQSQRTIQTIPVVYVLYRDGLIYFIVIALCSVFNLVVWRWFPPTLLALAKYSTFAFVNVMASRMVLNLRQIGEQETEEVGQDVLVFVETSITFEREFPRSPNHNNRHQSYHPQNLQHLRNFSRPRSLTSPTTFRPTKMHPSPKNVWTPSCGLTHNVLSRLNKCPSELSMDYEMDMVPSGSGEPGTGDDNRSSSDLEANFPVYGMSLDRIPRDQV